MEIQVSKISLLVIFWFSISALGQQQSTGAPASSLPDRPHLLEKTANLGSEVRTGNVKIPFISRAYSEMESELEIVPNFVSIQKIVQSRRYSWITDPQVIKTLDLEMRVETEGDSGVENIKFNSMSDGSTVLTDSARIQSEYNKRGLQVVGTFSEALKLPFSGGNSPVPVEARTIDRPSGGTRLSSVFSFDTNPQKPIAISSAVAGRPEDKEFWIPLRGLVFFDRETGRILRLEFDGYDFPKESAIQYIHQEIQYGFASIAGSKEMYWLPNRSVTVIGASEKDYMQSDTEFVSYKKFGMKSKIIFGGDAESTSDSSKDEIQKP